MDGISPFGQRDLPGGDLIVTREVQQLQREGSNVLDFALSLPDCAKSSALPISGAAMT